MDRTTSGSPVAIAYFGFDANDAAVRRRCSELQKAGAEVTAFCFERGIKTSSDSPSWRVVALGRTYDGWLFARALPLGIGLMRILAHARTVRHADILYCRSLDMALLGLAAKSLLRARGKFVYEVLDIHRLCAAQGPSARIARWLERFVLRATSLLVVSSQAFVDRYFQELQSYTGPSFLMENRVTGIQATQSRLPTLPAAKEPWIVGYFGKFRCVKSLELLDQLSRSAKGRVRIILCGAPQPNVKAVFERIVATNPYVQFSGPFAYPDQLQDIYTRVHFNWCLDWSDDYNAKLLLPNRVYEGGLFGVPAIAEGDTETGRFVQKTGLGVTLSPFSAEALLTFFNDLTSTDFDKIRTDIGKVPAERFLAAGQHAALVKMIAATEP